MQKFILSLFCLLILASTATQAQSNAWTSVSESLIPATTKQSQNIIPTAYQSYQLDIKNLKSQLAHAPMEFRADGQQEKRSIAISIPMPDGDLSTFDVRESPVMMAEISKRYPNIRSYKGYSQTDKHTSIRFVVSPQGFHGVLNSPKGEIYIDPYTPGQDFYLTYYTKDYLSQIPVDLHTTCGFEDDVSALDLPEIPENWHPSRNTASSRSAEAADVVEMRVYRLVIGANGEWTQAHGGTVESGLAGMNVATSRMNSILEREFAIRLILIDQEDDVIYTNGFLDPYTESPSEGADLLSQNTGVLDSVIGPTTYDFGHMFTIGCSGGLGGIANLASVCGTNKGAGVTCHFSNNIDAMVSRITAHEMGHQLGANHTFNNCNGNENSSTAYEPGGGSTIMSYAGSCGDHIVQGSPDSYYHVASLQEVYRFSFEGGPGYDCPQKVVINNHFPEVKIVEEGGFYIPKETPFELHAEASDEDGDELTYNWEQFNKGPISPLGDPQGDAPLFRTFLPDSRPYRIFPKIETILSNGFDRTELLPTYSRNMTFRCIARDNNPEGGVATWDEIKFKATGEAGPFLVTYPNNFVTINGGSFVEITWDVANTDKAPVNCLGVDILLSEDGGYTYPHTLAVAARNDGSHTVFFPNINTNEARLKIKGNGNIFFDLSNRNFQVFPTAEPGYTTQMLPFSQVICNPAEVATMDIVVGSILGFNEPVSLSLVNLPPNVNANFSKTSLLPGETSTLTVDFTQTDMDEIVDLTYRTTTAGGDTLYHDFAINVVNNNFSALTLDSPINGAGNVNQLVPYAWTLSPFAETYDIEVAYSPLFEDLAFSDYGLTEGSFAPIDLLEKNVLVYWRVRPNNECGSGDWVISTFHTENFQCSFFNNTDLNIPIGKQVGSITESILFVPESGIIEDLDMDRLDMTYAPIGGMDIRLISPTGTEVILMSNKCSNTGVIKTTFDDEAPNTIICPPDGFESYIPQEPLSGFDGEEVSGEWKLRIETLESGFSVGKLNSWNLETCAKFTPKNPFIVVNELLPVKTNDARFITKDFLEVKDENNTSTELIYTLVIAPENGILDAYGSVLTVGRTFPQDFIYDFGLKYTHNGNDAISDAFYFTVTDGDGGSIGLTKFNIDISEDNLPVGTFNPALDNDIALFPNPASTSVMLQLNTPLQEKATLQIFDLAGRQIHNYELATGSQQQQMDISNLTDGIYLVQLRTGQQILSKKLSVIR